MIKALYIQNRSDILGSAASALCLVHCLATPFLFVAQAGHLYEHAASPLWWGGLDLFFIAISLIAVYWSAKTTSKKWVAYGLWVSWALLTFVILNEKFELMHMAEAGIYFPSLALIGLHLYNRKYCRCDNDGCCAA